MYHMPGEEVFGLKTQNSIKQTGHITNSYIQNFKVLTKRVRLSACSKMEMPMSTSVAGLTGPQCDSMFSYTGLSLKQAAAGPIVFREEGKRAVSKLRWLVVWEELEKGSTTDN